MPIAALLMLAQAVAPPPVSTEQADARCMAAFALLANTDQPAQKQAATLGVLYYYAKVLGRRPGFDLKSVITSGFRANGANASAELGRCTDEVRAAGERMVAVGRELQAENAAPPTPRKP